MVIISLGLPLPQRLALVLTIAFAKRRPLYADDLPDQRTGGGWFDVTQGLGTIGLKTEHQPSWMMAVSRRARAEAARPRRHSRDPPRRMGVART